MQRSASKTIKLLDTHKEQLRVMKKWMESQQFNPRSGVKLEGVEAPLTYAGISREKVSSRSMRIPMSVPMFGLDEIEEMEGYDLAVRY